MMKTTLPDPIFPAHLGLMPNGPAPHVTRNPVTARQDLPGGIAARYALDTADWLWDSTIAPVTPAFRRLLLAFTSDGTPLRFQVSGDQFFWLALDGHIIARGPDVSPAWHYAFAQYTVHASAGAHTLEAFVWWVGDLGPEARMTGDRPGFALAGLDQWQPILSTGFAPWQIAAVEGYSLEPDAKQAEVLATGKNGLIDARAFFANQPVWQAPVVTQARLGTSAWGTRFTNRQLAPSALPEMPLRPIAPGRIRAVLDEHLGENPLPAEALTHSSLPDLQTLLSDDTTITIEPHSRRTLIWDLENYYTGWPTLTVSGGRDAILRQVWSESFYIDVNCRTQHKGNRNEIVGKYLVEGLGDRFIFDGGSRRSFVPYWWRAGRYCLLEITTGDEALTLHHLGLIASGHPFDWIGSFSCDQDEQIAPILQICRRTLEVSSWDSYEDSPYYEQLQYIGDTRLEILMTYVLNANVTLPLRALELLDQSRHQWGGLAAARFPSRGPQLITPFSLIWIWCVRDLMLWRDEPALLARLRPGVRQTLDIFHQWRRPDGLLENIPGWPFIDWVTPDRQQPDAWEKGVPASGRKGVSALVNLTYLLSLQAAVEIEQAAGETELAARCTRLADATAAALRARFWCPETGALKDDDSGNHWCTQAQIYGILSGILSPEEGLAALDRAERENWIPPSYMFRHYEFEALRKLGRAGEIIERLDAWQEMIDQGSFTVWEGLEPSRSDCHAWSSHPLFHLPCSVAGIRPAAPGFARIDIAPQLGPLTRIDTTVAHPRGQIEVHLTRTAEHLTGTITLPPGTDGTFRYGNRIQPMHAGTQNVSLT